MNTLKAMLSWILSIVARLSVAMAAVVGIMVLMMCEWTFGFVSLGILLLVGPAYYLYKDFINDFKEIKQIKSTKVNVR